MESTNQNAVNSENTNGEGTNQAPEVKPVLGRPANPDSARQKRLADLEKRRQEGTLKLGRPANPDSERQARLKEMETKRANGELKKGRPVVGHSKRQQTLAERAAKIAAGIPVKRGRPKFAKNLEAVETPTPEIHISTEPEVVMNDATPATPKKGKGKKAKAE